MKKGLLKTLFVFVLLLVSKNVVTMGSLIKYVQEVLLD